jgi:basic membrane lipoprotein Med (substrate-binding protein (PBP1-ABC) superfamily)
MKQLSLRIGIAIWIGIVACGCTGGTQSEKPQPESPKETAAQPVEGAFKVALITPTSVNDSGWSALAYRGLEAIRANLGAEIANVVASTPADIEDAMRSFAQQGFQLVIGHGYEYNQHGIKIGKEFPKTVFVSSSGDQSAPNVGAFRFYLEQATYLLGMMAAKMTKTGVVGMVGGPDVPSIESTFQAFEAGAKAVRPNITVLKAYTGSNDDIGAAKQQTLAFINRGADFIIHQANAAAQGVFEACRERKVWAFGTNSDQSSVAPDVVLASAVIRAESVFTDLAKRVKNGTYRGSVELVGAKEGAVNVVFNPKLLDQIPKEVQDLLTQKFDEIMQGKLVVPKLEF